METVISAITTTTMVTTTATTDNITSTPTPTTATGTVTTTATVAASIGAATGAVKAIRTTSIGSSSYGKLRDTGSPLVREDFDGGPISLDEIEPGLFLGNLSAATHMDTLKTFKITHILTLDSVPLPQHISGASFLTTKFVQIADMPREDMLHHLEPCIKFITQALEDKGNILVHCYFGFSRSSTAVIAYVMKRYNLEYAQAYDLVKSKRRFVQPNPGFVAQLKLYQRMGCKIEPQYQKYKLFRLRLAGEKMRKAKILPQNFMNVIKPDPAIAQENPEPIVYRCRKCRRVLASKSHVLVHQSKSTAPANANSNAQNASGQMTLAAAAGNAPRLLDQIAAQIRKVSLGSPTLEGGGQVDGATGNAGVASTMATATTTEQNTANCRSIVFVEPIAWMKFITTCNQGRLNCPKCEQKLGHFSWVNSCQCPCGEEISPAFYMISSRVELSKAVQNVQTTL